jgi:hypothetical protein
MKPQVSQATLLSLTALRRLFEVMRKLTNSVALVRERTIKTESPPLVGEVSTNFCG